MQHLEQVIKSRIPGLQSLITKTIAELETELNRLGKPIANDAGVRQPTILLLAVQCCVHIVFHTVLISVYLAVLSASITKYALQFLRISIDQPAQ
jgi:hypothetical protein